MIETIFLKDCTSLKKDVQPCHNSYRKTENPLRVASRGPGLSLQQSDKYDSLHGPYVALYIYEHNSYSLPLSPFIYNINLTS